jgi:hypothetical protein
VHFPASVQRGICSSDVDAGYSMNAAKVVDKVFVAAGGLVENTLSSAHVARSSAALAALISTRVEVSRTCF